MKTSNLIRPDKLLFQGLKALTSLGQSFYTEVKSEAKAKAELTFIGEKKVEKVQSQLFTYNSDSCTENKKLKDLNFFKSLSATETKWLNFHGIHEVDLIKQVGQAAGLERLMIRQILDTTQRPKVEEYDNHLFFSIKSISKEEQGLIEIEQVSFVLGEELVISFQEERGDHFDSIRNKLKENLGYLRKRTSDYLLSQLLDAILDNYFETIEQVNRDIALLEKSVFENPDKSILVLLESHKKSAQLIKKSLNPFNDALQTILNDRTKLIKEQNVKYYKDLAHSALSALEEIDTILRTLEGLTNIYFASLSQKMNETMKVLTTVATIFIPLTFIAGVYGMNFENMPELGSRYGYYITWGVMIVIAAGMMVYFKRKKWL